MDNLRRLSFYGFFVASQLTFWGCKQDAGTSPFTS